MSELAYPEIIGELSKHIKVIWFNREFPRRLDPWKELGKHTIRVGFAINVEEILDRKGEEDAEEYF